MPKRVPPPVSHQAGNLLSSNKSGLVQSLQTGGQMLIGQTGGSAGKTK